MNSECLSYQDQMTSYLAGELSTDETAALRRHVGDCALCQNELESLGNTFVMLRARFQGVHLELRTDGTAQTARPIGIRQWLRRAALSGSLAAGLALVTWVSMDVRDDHSPADPAGSTFRVAVEVDDVDRQVIASPSLSASKEPLYGVGNDPTYAWSGLPMPDPAPRHRTGIALAANLEPIAYFIPPAYGLGYHPGLEFQ